MEARLVRKEKAVGIEMNRQSILDVSLEPYWEQEEGSVCCLGDRWCTRGVGGGCAHAG